MEEKTQKNYDESQIKNHCTMKMEQFYQLIYSLKNHSDQ